MVVGHSAHFPLRQQPLRPRITSPTRHFTHLPLAVPSQFGKFNGHPLIITLLNGDYHRWYNVSTSMKALPAYLLCRKVIVRFCGVRVLEIIKLECSAWCAYNDWLNCLVLIDIILFYVICCKLIRLRRYVYTHVQCRFFLFPFIVIIF